MEKIFGKCAECGRDILHGNACVSINHNIEQPDWNEQLESAEITVAYSRCILLLCAGCGNRLDLTRTRFAMRPIRQTALPAPPAASEAVERTPEQVDEEALPGEDGWVDLADAVRECQQNLPRARKGGTAWFGYPHEEAGYQLYLRYVLGKASDRRPGSAAGADGDFRNGLIDYSSREEGSGVHWGLDVQGGRAGWIDPSFSTIGSCSREVELARIVQEQPCHVQISRRSLSLVSLDRPNWIAPDDEGSFYQEVISPLLDLKEEDDNLLGWLDVMFRYCAGKRFAYFSHYVPSTTIYTLAQVHGVELVHCPLESIPLPYRERNETFHFLCLTRRQHKIWIERAKDLAWDLYPELFVPGYQSS